MEPVSSIHDEVDILKVRSIGLRLIKHRLPSGVEKVQLYSNIRIWNVHLQHSRDIVLSN